MLLNLKRVVPENTFCFVLIQIFSTLSFAVLYSTLVLFITNKLGMSEHFANNLTGIFLALHFVLNLLGGFIGGRFISYRNLFLVGVLLECIGILVVSSSTLSSLFVGLSIFLAGSGLYVTSLNCILTQQFEKNKSHNRETAFYWVYSGMNIGFLIGYSLSGWFTHTNNYSSLFILASLSSIIAMLIFVLNWSRMKDKETPIIRLPAQKQKQRTTLSIFFIIFLIPLIMVMMSHSNLSNELVLLIGISMLLVLFAFSYKQKKNEDRRKILAFLSLLIAALVFWSLYYIGPMGMTLFIKTHVNRDIRGFNIPIQWFNNINTLIIIIGPLLAKYFNHLRSKGLKLAVPTQFTIGLFFIGLAYIVLMVSIKAASSSISISPYSIIFYYLLQSIGELFISPIGYAMVGTLAPTNLQGIMMGTWMLISGVASTVAQYFSNIMITPSESSGDNINAFMQSFGLLGASALICSLLLFLLIPSLNKLMGITGNSNENKLSYAS